MGQTAVNPPRAAARVPVSMVSEDLAARLAQVAMQIDEARRDDQARGVERLAILRRRLASRGPRAGCDPRDAVAVEQNVERRIGAARGIEHASILNPQHGRSLWAR